MTNHANTTVAGQARFVPQQGWFLHGHANNKNPMSVSVDQAVETWAHLWDVNENGLRERLLENPLETVVLSADDIFLSTHPDFLALPFAAWWKEQRNNWNDDELHYNFIVMQKRDTLRVPAGTWGYVVQRPGDHYVLIDWRYMPSMSLGHWTSPYFGYQGKQICKLEDLYLVNAIDF